MERRSSPLTGLANVMARGSTIAAAPPVAQQLGSPAQPTFMLHAQPMNGYADGGQVPMGPGAMQGTPPPPQPAAGLGGASSIPNDQLQAELQQFVKSNPEAVEKVRQAIEQALAAGALTQQDLQMAVQMAVAAAQNPELYPRLREMAIAKGLAGEDEIPMQYDQGLVFALLLAGAAVSGGAPQAQAAPIGMANGGHIPQVVSPTGDNTGRADDIPIRVSGGEYVIPAEVVARKGTDFFDKMTGKELPEKAGIPNG